ncbi:hypothetical protein COB11_01045 [Candidatus Aerophobetes bacterium]|uniref:Spermidine/putrescine ABC transporter substrate-binding protein n=1 Tax=Aerophobetes bacterium TaxID=2030807 RepID=A0A2A4YM84_UNCAE|nr:MAG: hypothetical protein COB11_01045 [Candidatus Aerophobetes bacterium]
MKKSFTLPSIFKRSVIILAWVTIIFLILFSSNFTSKIKNNEKTLHIFTWSDVIPSGVIKNFEEEYGIKVVLDYYSSNEELFIKLKASKGAGYDLIIPSDYAVKSLSRDGYLKKLDKSKLGFIDDINPMLLSHDYDPENHYSLPLQWDVIGFGVNTEKFKHSIDDFTWDHLFNENILSYKIAMSNDPVEAFCLASFYLFGKKAALTPKEALQAKDLLTTQKKWVEAYAVPRSDFILASKNAAIAYSLSAHVIRSKKDFPFMQFAVPKDSTFISIENIAIPANNNNNENIYKFLNYLYQPENLAEACNEFGVFPGTIKPRELLKYKEDFDRIQKTITKDGYELHFFRHLIPEEEMRSLWIDVKS